MSKPEIFAQIEHLCKQFFDGHISYADYRRLRNSLLKKIDAEYNGAH